MKQHHYYYLLNSVALIFFHVILCIKWYKMKSSEITEETVLPRKMWRDICDSLSFFFQIRYGCEFWDSSHTLAFSHLNQRASRWVIRCVTPSSKSSLIFVAFYFLMKNPVKILTHLGAIRPWLQCRLPLQSDRWLSVGRDGETLWYSAGWS